MKKIITTSSYQKKAQHRISDDYEGSAEQKWHRARKLRFLKWKDEVDQIILAKQWTGKTSSWDWKNAFLGDKLSPEAAVDEFITEARAAARFEASEAEVRCDYCDDPNPDFDPRAEIPNMCRDCWESEVASRNERDNPLADPEWRSDGF